MGVNISVPGEKLLCKLWETIIEKGLGGLLEPWQIRRVGNARLEKERRKKLMSAQLKKEIALIEQGKVVLDSKFNLISGLEKNCTIGNDYIEKTLSNQITKMMSKEVNISSSILYAEEMLMKDESIPSAETVDQDWLNQWAEYAGLVSEEKLQELWGRILAGEVKSPGKYSLRTLTFIKHLSKKDAESINNIAPFILNNFIVRDLVKSTNKIPLGLLLHCQELGIIQGMEFLGIKNTWDSSRTDRFERVLALADKLFIIKASNPAKLLELPVYTLTSLGEEIISLIRFKVDEAYLTEVGKYIVDQGFKVQVTSTWGINPDGAIDYFDVENII